MATLGEILAPQTGLVSLYSLNGASTDTGSNGANGTDTSITYPQGKFNQAANFSGSGYITFSAVNNFERTSTFSVSLWFNHGVGTQGSIIAKQKNSSPFNGWYIDKFNNPIFRVGMTGSDGSALFGDTAGGYEDNLWHQLVMTYDGSQSSTGLLCYIDGASVALSYTSTIAANIANAFNMMIGAREVSGFPYTGKLDNVGIWTYVLSPQRIRLLYAQAVGKLQ